MPNKLTLEEFITKAKSIHNDKFDYSLVNYVNSKTLIKIKCNTCLLIFEQTPSGHIKIEKCMNCYLTSEFITKANSIHNNNKFDYSLVIYINSKTLIKIKCNTCLIIFEQTPKKHTKIEKCMNCYLTSEFIKKAKSIHNDKFDYSLVNSIKSIKIKCNTCLLVFEQTPNQHIKNKKCMNCYKINMTLLFIKKAKEIHENKYDYTNTKYISGVNTKITFVCNKCNSECTQFVNNHLQGCGCRNCWLKDIRFTKEEFIENAKKVHGNNFNYDLVEYLNAYTKVTIKCNKCNTIFEQTPCGHVNHEHKCLKCTHDNQRKTNKEFIKEAIEIHGDKYNYDLVEYFNAYTKIKIFCNKCENIFEQDSRNHLGGKKGCSRCNISK